MRGNFNHHPERRFIQTGKFEALVRAHPDAVGHFLRHTRKSPEDKIIGGMAIEHLDVWGTEHLGCWRVKLGGQSLFVKSSGGWHLSEGPQGYAQFRLISQIQSILLKNGLSDDIRMVECLAGYSSPRRGYLVMEYLDLPMFAEAEKSQLFPPRRMEAVRESLGKAEGLLSCLGITDLDDQHTFFDPIAMKAVWIDPSFD